MGANERENEMVGGVRMDGYKVKSPAYVLNQNLSKLRDEFLAKLESTFITRRYSHKESRGPG